MNTNYDIFGEEGGIFEIGDGGRLVKCQPEENGELPIGAMIVPFTHQASPEIVRILKDGATIHFGQTTGKLALVKENQVSPIVITMEDFISLASNDLVRHVHRTGSFLSPLKEVSDIYELC